MQPRGQQLIVGHREPFPHGGQAAVAGSANGHHV